MSEEYRKVEVRATGPSGADVTVFLDGEPVKDLAECHLVFKAGEVNRVFLTFNAVKADVVVDSEVVVKEPATLEGKE